MSRKIVEFPDRKAVAEEAAAWLIRLDGDGAPSADDLASLRGWLERSPVHREQLNSLAAFWGKMNVLTELAVPLGHADGRAAQTSISGPRFSFSRFARAGIVTAVLLVGLAGSVMLRPDLLLSSNDLYATAVGQQRSVTLSDGSLVILNTNTQIKVDYDDEYRDIRLLQGEAHFTVAKNALRPFRVYAGNGRVQAVGTAFSVYLKGNTVNVTVTEGEVALASIDQSVDDGMPTVDVSSRDTRLSGSIAAVDDRFVEALSTIKAGESATIQSALASGDAQVINERVINEIETVEAREMAKRLSWREGMLTFAGDPLVVVVDEISRYTTVSIEITDPVVKATRIGGRFPIGETDAMFDALEANFGLRVTRLSHDRVLVSAAAD
jgi:transmembrane sensor